MKRAAQPLENLVSQEQRRKLRDEEEDERTRNSRRSYPGVIIGYPEPHWNKKLLPYLYEDIRYTGTATDYFFDGKPQNRLEDLPKSQIAVVSISLCVEDKEQIIKSEQFVSGGSIKTLVTLKEENSLNRVLWWKTPYVKGINTPEKEEERLKHWRSVNSYHPYLFGKQHFNRLIRGTKVYVLSGTFKDYYGTVVGHKGGFDINNNKAPRLKILLTDSEGISPPLIYIISQWIVKIIDFHNKVGFAIPTKSPKN